MPAAIKLAQDTNTSLHEETPSSDNTPPSSWLDGDSYTSFSIQQTPEEIKANIGKAVEQARTAADNHPKELSRRVGNFWLALGRIDGTLQFPKEVTGKSITEITHSFKDILPDLSEKTIHQTSDPDRMAIDIDAVDPKHMDVSIAKDAPETFMELSDGKGKAIVIEKGGYVWINSAEANGAGAYTDPRLRAKASLGAPAYQIAQIYARNNGLKFIPDPYAVSEVAQFRRWSQMLSSSIRSGSTDHIRASLDVHNWTHGKDAAADTGTLALHEYEYVKQFFPEIEDLRLSDDLHSLQHDDGTRISSTALDDLLTGRRDPSLTGIGDATLRRAIATRSATNSKKVVSSKTPVAETGQFGLYTRGIEDLLRHRGGVGTESGRGDQPLNEIAYSLAPIGAGPKPITEAPKPVSLSNPFPEHITQPSELRKEFWKNFDTITKNWPKVIDTPEGPIAWSKGKAGHKLKFFKDGEPAMLHFIAAVHLPELLANSKLASVEPELKNDHTVEEIHRRYAWARFPNHQMRHILLTVERMSDRASEKLQQADQAYSSEVLGISLEILPENKSADVVTLQAGDELNPTHILADTPTHKDLTRFLSGIKPEHRHPNTISEQSK